jgi:REP element-mobilizing transposase RayT
MAAEQLSLPLRSWGGARKGAGRKPNGPRAGVSHLARPKLAGRFPVHVTVRMRPHVWNLRSSRSFSVLGAAISRSQRLGMRVCAFSVQGNHVHLVVEAGDRETLGRGMQSFGIRTAKGLNRMMGTRGRVLADRYHAHILKTPSEVRSAVRYVRDNRRRHLAAVGEVLSTGYVDRFSSSDAAARALVTAPRTWLLSRWIAST